MDRQLFSYILTKIQPILMNSVGKSNSIVLKTVSQALGISSASPNYASDVESKVPLWILSGGEAINLYSLNHTQTKDLDFKVLFFGEWSIPQNYFIFQSQGGILNDLLRNFARRELVWDKLFITNTTTYLYNNLPIKGYFPCNLQVWNQHNAKIVDVNNQAYNLIEQSWLATPSKYSIFKLIGDSRRNIIYKVISSFNDCNNQLELLDGTSMPVRINVFTTEMFTKGFSALFAYAGQQNVLPDGRIPIRLTMPFLGSPTLNHQSHKYFPYFPTNANIDYTNPQILMQILPDAAGFINMLRLGQAIDDWCLLDENNRFNITNQFLLTLEASSLTTLLRSLFTAIFYVTHHPEAQAPNDWSIDVSYEGVLDLFIDPSAGDNPEGKKIYEGKKSDGNIPCILTAINFCDTDTNRNELTLLKIPTLNWLLRDQTRMLFHAIKGVDTTHQGWTKNTFGVAPSTIDPNKYYKKVNGLLEAQLKGVEYLEQNNGNLQKQVLDYFGVDCIDVLNCGPDSFISVILKIINKDYWARLSVNCRSIAPAGTAPAGTGVRGGKHKYAIKKRKTYKRERKGRKTRKL